MIPTLKLMMTKKLLLTSAVLCAALLLVLSPAAFAAESSLSVYGGSAKDLVAVGDGGAPLPSTGLAVGALVLAGAMLVGVGAGARRFAADRD